MLYLAQVQNNVNSGQLNLKLLAYETTENLWEVNHQDLINLEYLNYDENCDQILTEGLLMLVDLDQDHKIISLKSANKWVLDLVKKYLTCPILNEDFVTQEQEKVEKWRQEMALQSQDLTRRNLELETRQEQLQDLEEKLKQQQKELEQK